MTFATGLVAGAHGRLLRPQAPRSRHPSTGSHASGGVVIVQLIAGPRRRAVPALSGDGVCRAAIQHTRWRARGDGTTVHALPKDTPAQFHKLQTDVLKGVMEDEHGVSRFGPKFDLPLAVALAGASFEAYLQPVGAEGFQEEGRNGTHTTFTDSEFLADVRQGVLHVELIRANGLRPADLNFKSDPYAVITVGDSMAKSRTIAANLNPEWNQAFVLYIKDMQKDLLKVRLYDEDWITADDDLGSAVVQLAELKPSERVDLTLPLTGPGGQGEVVLRVMPLKFSDHLLDAMTSDGSVLPEQAEEVSVQEGQPGEKVLAVAAGAEVPESPTPTYVLPGFDELKDQVSSALDKLGLLNTKGGVTSEEVAANPWKVLARMAGSDHPSSWTPVAYIDNDDTDTQVWIYRSKTNKEVVVAFRGTEQVKWKDLATDLNLVPCSLNPERVDDGASMPLPMRILRAAVPNNDMTVHEGFLSAFDSVRPQVYSLVDAICMSSGSPSNPLDHAAPWKVFVTGHSLGGALATLCAFELATRKGSARSRQAVSLYTYGAPRVGNKVFADAYNKAVPDSWRVTNSRDIIPSVPRLLGYAHVKHSVRVTEDGKLTIQADAGEDVFGEGRGGLEVLQELVDAVTEQERTLEDVYDEIAAAELAILDRLVSGKALEEHMEDFYLATLQQVVVASTGVAVTAATKTQEAGKAT